MADPTTAETPLRYALAAPGDIEAGYSPLGIHPQYRGFALFEKHL